MAAETNNPSQKPNQLTVPPPAPGTHVRTGGAPAAAPGAGAAARPQKEKALHCPRCNSTNTKFCYYNDYSLRMPRYFCKTCRRYWTEGGALRNVPAEKDTGPGSSSAVSAPAPAASSSTGSGGTTIPVVSLAAKKNPTLIHEGARDLGLAFGLPRHGDGRGLRPPGEFLSLETCGGACNDGDAGGRDVGVVSAMDLLRSTGCYVASPHVQLGNAAAAFALGELRMPPAPPPRRFSLDTGLQQDGEESAAGRLLFPFQALTLAASAAGGANAGADQYDAGKDEGGDSGDGEASSALRFVADIGEEVEVID